jgi:hypothetical protein
MPQEWNNMRCPSFERFIDYLENQLDPSEAAGLTAHLNTGCKHCAEIRDWYQRVRELTASDESVEPPSWVFKRAVRIFESQPGRPHIVERIGHAIASLVFDSLARPAIAGIRSTETTNRQLLYRAGDYSIDLQVVPAEHLRGDLIGQILKEDEAAFESVAGLRLEIIRRGESVFSTTSDEMGEFKISGLEYGVYDLLVEVGDGNIIVQGLPISQS